MMSLSQPTSRTFMFISKGFAVCRTDRPLSWGGWVSECLCWLGWLLDLIRWLRGGARRTFRESPSAALAAQLAGLECAGWANWLAGLAGLCWLTGQAVAGWRGELVRPGPAAADGIVESLVEGDPPATEQTDEARSDQNGA